MSKLTKPLVAFIRNFFVVALTVYTYVLLFSPDTITFGTVVLMGLWSLPVTLAMVGLIVLLTLLLVALPLSLHEAYHSKSTKRTVS